MIFNFYQNLINFKLGTVNCKKAVPDDFTQEWLTEDLPLSLGYDPKFALTFM